MNKPFERRGLVLTPFSEDFRPIRKLIADVLKEIGIKPVMLDDMSPATAALPELVKKTIENADIIIADLTGINPNVMYEIGFAHALNKQVLPIVQDNVRKIPFDMSGYLYLVYNPSNPRDLSDLRENIKTWVMRFLKQHLEQEVLYE